MRKIFSAMLLIAIFCVPILAQAEEGMKEGQMPMGMEHGKKCCPMLGKPSMLATQDGGVVVLVGNKLQKYDQNLTLIKEVELPMLPKPGPMMEKMGAGTEQSVQQTIEQPAEVTEPKAE